MLSHCRDTPKYSFKNKTYICAHVHIADTLASDKGQTLPNQKGGSQRDGGAPPLSTRADDLFDSAHTCGFFSSERDD